MYSSSRLPARSVSAGRNYMPDSHAGLPASLPRGQPGRMRLRLGGKYNALKCSGFEVKRSPIPKTKRLGVPKGLAVDQAPRHCLRGELLTVWRAMSKWMPEAILLTESD